MPFSEYPATCPCLTVAIASSVEISDLGSAAFMVMAVARAKMLRIVFCMVLSIFVSVKFNIILTVQN